jgi:hypothetical protein
MMIFLRYLALVVVFLFTTISFNLNAQVWTWKKGANTVNNLSTYGTLGTGTSSTTPGSRYGSLSWTDNSGNFWLFGGEGYGASTNGRLNDLWKFNTTSNTWTWMSGSTYPGAAGIYGTLGTGSSTNTPGARAYSATWVDNSGNLWLFGGEGYDVNGSFGNLNDLWKYTISTNTWAWISGSNLVNQSSSYGILGVASSTNIPGSRRLLSGWTDGSGNLYIFGGYGDASGSVGSLSDLWKYNISSNQWTWLSGPSTINQLSVFGLLGISAGTNSPGARYGFTAWKDNSGNFWLCNGYGYDGSGQGHLSDIWKYSPGTGLWTWMDGSSTVNEGFVGGIKGVPSSSNTPGGRHFSASWPDGSGNLYLIGGYNGGPCSDLWQYSISTGNWTWIKGGNAAGIYGTLGTATVSNDPGAGYLRTSWKDNSGNFWLFGGNGYDVNSNNSHLNELWKTTLATTAPTASFSFNQTAQVCMGTRILISDLSTNQPVAWTYSLDGVSWSGAQNPYLQNLPTVTLSAGVHTVSLLVANSAGYSTPFTQTINVINSSIPSLTTAPSGSLNLYIGNGQTQNSDWAPWVFYFSDPLPAGASITRVIMTYNGVDQGWGGSGVGASMYLADTYMGAPALSHSWQSLSIDFTGSFPNYVNGGTNTFKMYFWGYSGWQAFISNANLQIFYQTNSVTVCAGNSVTLTANGASTYTWTNGAVNGASHVPTATSIYTVNATAANGCVTSATEAVIVNPLPTITVNSGEICSGDSFTINPSGASTYTYSGGSVVSPAATSAFSVTGTSTAGCVSANPGISNVTVNPLPSISVNSGAICIGKSFTITPSGASTYTYSGGSSVVSPTTTTSYSVTGTNPKGCVSSGPAISIVNVNALPVISVTGNTAVCIGSSVSQTAAGATTYSWSNGATGNLLTVSPTVATTYTVTGTDSNGCESTSVKVVNVNPLPIVSVSGGAICAGSSFMLIPSGASTYTYSGGSANVIPSTTTNYTVTGTSPSGCVSLPAIATVTVNPLPVLNITGLSSVCFGSSLTQTVSGAVSYSWSSGALTNTVSLSPSSGTTYTVTGTSAAGCPNTATKLITVNPLPVITANNGTICSGNSFTISPSGAITYTYSSGSNIVSPITSTSYSITGTDALGCVSAGAAVSNVVVNITPTVSVNSGTICSGKSFSIQPAGASVYTVTGGSFNVSPPSNSNYTVTGTSAEGCTSSNFAVSAVTVIALPVLTITGASSVCYGSSVGLAVTGASTYTWSNSAFTSSVMLTPSVNTSYSVTGTSVAGCSATVSKFITVNPLPVITVNNGTICSGNSFTIIPSGAISYTYSGGSSVVSPVSTTNFSVTGTDALGCISGSPAISNVVVNISPTISVNSGITCAGETFTITPTGANTYSISGGSSIVNPVVSTNYSVTGMSALGCPGTNTAVSALTVNPLPVLSVSGPNNVCSGASATQTVSGAISYTWSSGAISNTTILTPSVSSIYTITGTSAQGCTNTVTKSVNVLPRPVITVNSGTICTGQTFILNPSGAASYSYSGGGNVVSPNITSSYSVTGTGGNGCNANSPAISTVVVNVSPTVSVNSGIICAGNSFTMLPSGASTYTYSSGTSVVSPASNTQYSVTGTSSLGCVSVNTAVSNVSVNPLPVLTINGPGAVCNGSSVTQTVTGANNYSWSTGATTNTLLVNITSPTIYIVSGTNTATGCSSTAYKQVIVGTQPVISVNSGNICSGNSFTMIPGGANTYTFSNGSTTINPVVTPTANTSYFVTGTSSLGCVSSGPAIANVIVNAPPNISVNSGGICSGGSYTIVPTGANTYTITGGNMIVSPSSTTSYSVTGTSILGCVSNVPAVATITVNPIPVISAPNGTICQGKSYTISPSGAATYTFSGGTGTVSPLTSTNYSVTGTSSAGCAASNTAIVTVAVNLLPTITVNSGTLCSGNTFTMIPSGGVSYTFSSGSQTVSPNVSQSYSVVGVNSFGCISSNTAVSNVTVLQTPTISANSGSICSGESYVIVPTGAATYTINGGGYTVTPSANSSYTITGTGNSGCISMNPAIVNVSVYATPTLSIAGPTAICQGNPANYTVSGSTNYLWSNNSTSSVISVSPFNSTTYSVSGTNISGCMNTASINLTVHQLPVLSVNSGSVCPLDTFIIVPTGALNYSITGGTFTITPLTSGFYTVTGVDSNGCAAEFPAISTVSVINTTTVSVTGKKILCLGDSTILTAAGATSYSWSNGSQTGSIVAGPSVTTVYTVTGNNGMCYDSRIVTVTVNALPQLTVTSTSDVLCNGESAILLTKGAVSYSWNTGNNTSSLTINPTTTIQYTVTGTDLNGCINSAVFTQTVSDCVSLSERDISYGVNIYPNPNSGRFFVEADRDFTLVIRNMLGQVITEEIIRKGITGIELRDQAKGLYFLQIKGSESSKNFRMIKQ